VLTHAGSSYDCATRDAIRAVAAQERDAAVHAAERLRAPRHRLPARQRGLDAHRAARPNTWKA